MRKVGHGQAAVERAGEERVRRCGWRRRSFRGRAAPLFSSRTAFVLFVVTPMPSACCFSSAMIATTAPSSTSSIEPPADVRPGDITLAPDRTNRMAPRSTRKKGSMSGYRWSMRSVGMNGPLRDWKKMNSLFGATMSWM